MCFSLIPAGICCPDLLNHSPGAWLRGVKLSGNPLGIDAPILTLTFRCVNQNESDVGHTTAFLRASSKDLLAHRCESARP